MPVYEYYCSHCHTKFDALRAMRQADDPIACENCERERTARVLSVFFATSAGQAVSRMSEGAGPRPPGAPPTPGPSHNSPPATLTKNRPPPPPTPPPPPPPLP